MRKKVDHTTIRNGMLFCMNCGRYQDMHLPVEIQMAAAMMKAFAQIHKNCPPTWKEPEVDQSKSVEYKAKFWFTHGERGASSEAIYYCLTGTGNRKDHPYDPDDFKRCYGLLKFVPEWRDELHKVKKLSPIWARLIDNWDTLTEMYERKDIGMYDFMQTLIKSNP